MLSILSFFQLFLERNYLMSIIDIVTAPRKMFSSYVLDYPRVYFSGVVFRCISVTIGVTAILIPYSVYSNGCKSAPNCGHPMFDNLDSPALHILNSIPCLKRSSVRLFVWFCVNFCRWKNKHERYTRQWVHPTYVCNKSRYILSHVIDWLIDSGVPLAHLVEMVVTHLVIIFSLWW